MSLEELKVQMAKQDARLEAAIQLSARGMIAQAAGRVRWLTPGLVLELLLAIIAVVWLGDFIAGHWRQPRFLIPAALLDLCAMALLGSCSWQLAVLARLDPQQPVMTLQKELSRLRVVRLRTTKWVFALAGLAWFPLMAVLLKGLLGVDLWASNLPWVVANVLFGLVVALVVLHVARRYVERGDPPRWADELAGRSLSQALKALETVKRFEAGA